VRRGLKPLRFRRRSPETGISSSTRARFRASDSKINFTIDLANSRNVALDGYILGGISNQAVHAFTPHSTWPGEASAIDVAPHLLRRLFDFAHRATVARLNLPAGSTLWVLPPWKRPAKRTCKFQFRLSAGHRNRAKACSATLRVSGLFILPGVETQYKTAI
jgi:hypothetical protein